MSRLPLVSSRTPSASRPRAGDLNDLATRGWASRLAAAVAAALAVEGVTGTWVWLAPFSAASQVQVLLHAVLGAALVPPLALFLLRHLRAWWRQRLTAVMALGYLLAALVVVAVASGIVLTVQAALGPAVSDGWRYVHLVSGIAATALLPLHVLLAWRRRRLAARGVPALRTAAGRFLRRGLAVAGAVAAAVVVGALSVPGRRAERPVPSGYVLPEVLQAWDEYRGSPFAPSFARTESGGLIAPDALAGSDSCGTSGCHETIHAEWQPSAHRFAAMNPPFQAVQRRFADDRGAAETRYCAGCHDPISLFAGAKDMRHRDLSAPGVREGISCAVCHSISRVDARGNADYVLSAPRKYLWEGHEGWRKAVSDFLVRALPRQHLADYDRNVLRTPEFCGACHKQFVPEALNRFGPSSGQNQYDEWRRSHWHVDDPVEDLACRDCHMRLVRGSSDPGRGEAGDARRSPDDGAHRHHGTVATNLFMPEVLGLPHWRDQVRLTEEWIRGETVLPEIAGVWPSGPVAAVELRAPKATRPGEEVEVRVIVRNRKAGHNLTTGPLDFVRAWVHLEVRAPDGRIVAEWGAIDPRTRRITDRPGEEHTIGNSRSEGTLVLEGQPTDRKGRPLRRHELWEKAGGEGRRVIFPGYADHQLYRFRVPADVTRGELAVRAELGFRRYRQEFLDLVVPDMERESGVRQRKVVQSSGAARIAVSPDDAGLAGGGGGG